MSAGLGAWEMVSVLPARGRVSGPFLPEVLGEAEVELVLEPGVAAED